LREGLIANTIEQGEVLALDTIELEQDCLRENIILIKSIFFYFLFPQTCDFGAETVRLFK